MTAQDVANAVSVDMRRQIGSTGADLSTMLGWIDRVHKEVLHSSLYGGLNTAKYTFTTTAGTSDYTLPSDVRRIRSVYNRTLSQVLFPIELLGAPASEMERTTPSVGGPQSPDARVLTMRVYGPFPAYYQRAGSTLIVYPEPRVAGESIEVTYERTVATITSAAQTLVVPDDGLDVIVAGVNALAAAYLKRNDEAQHWYLVYQKLLVGEAKA